MNRRRPWNLNVKIQMCIRDRDEPTNDLDLDTLMWLERFMNEYEGALLYVSHDETLLSRTATLSLIHI